MMTLALAFAQYYNSSRYESSYNGAWVIGFIIGLFLALGIARLISWGIRKLLEKTVVRDQKRHAAFIAFIISSVLAIIFVIVTAPSRASEEYTVGYTDGGRIVERVEYFSTTTRSLIYVGMMFLWLMVDLKLADRDYAKEISIFAPKDAEQPSGLGLGANYAAGNVAPTLAFQPPRMVYQPPVETMAPAPSGFSQRDSNELRTTQQSSNVSSVFDLIEQLARLRDSGVLSNEEFEEKKNELLRRI